VSFDALVVAAHPDDAEAQMGGTLARLTDRGQRILLVDLTDGEPTEFAAAGVRAGQAAEAAQILGVDRVCLGLPDRLLQDTPEARLGLARLIRENIGRPGCTAQARRACTPITSRPPVSPAPRCSWPGWASGTG